MPNKDDERLNSLIVGNVRFQQGLFADKRERFLKLIAGQKPRALYIGCADSRVVPNFIIDAGAGEVFVIRNIGAVIPPRSHPESESIAAAVEYAICVLQVPRIVVCAHDHCGALKAIHGGARPGTALGDWLTRAASDIPHTEPALKDVPLPALAERFARTQYNHLSEYELARTAAANGRITLHAWVYNPENGRIRQMAEDGTFKEVVAEKSAPPTWDPTSG